MSTQKPCLTLLVFLMMLGLALPTWAGNPYGGENIGGVQNTNVGQAGQAPQTTAVAVTIPDQFVGTVSTGDATLNVRTGPWGDILGTIPNGTKIKVIGKQFDWYKVEYQGKTAYVHSTWVLAPGEKAKSFPRAGWVNASTGLNVRRVPNGDVIGTLKDQQHVEILGVAGDFYKIKYGNNEAFVSRKYIDTDQPSGPSSDEVKPANFIGYVTASSLNVRESPWGAIRDQLPYGIAIQVTGRVGDWYRVNFNGKTRYVHANYITKDRQDVVDNKPHVNPGEVGTDPGPAGSLQTKIAYQARKLIGSTSFRGADVAGGNLACAKVATTALKNAGALDKVHLNCRSAVADLKSKGWKEVSVPPFREGDVITWKTYDYTGDGVKDPDTHIGIIVKDGGSFKAMNNSSRLRTPRLTDTNIAPITRVLRKD